MTYGPFTADGLESTLPALPRIHADFELMRASGINAIRTYQVPPSSLLKAAEKYGLVVFVDVPWSKHVCFLDSPRLRAEARLAVRRAVTCCREFPCVLGYSVGNEIPADIVRWHGARQIERFIRELAYTAKQVDHQALVTYGNYPPTEFLDLPFLDFAMFNVYLHDREAFHRYLHRLQNLVGDRPLVLGEIGMDSLRHGESEQAEHISGQLREVALQGLAGAFVFSWTDDWHTGGQQIEDWAFGLTDSVRAPKAALIALHGVFESSQASLLESTPRVSVVVCSYNGGATLGDCLHSLSELNYPNYEIIVVDDGSTDNTSRILENFPWIRVIAQPNRGLSAARNAGLFAASGDIVAYTDADCIADSDWLIHLVYQLQKTGADAVGGPNLSPDDGWLAACIAASPGQPTHVLENDQVAEHIPGCNMAFRREALLAINGFQEQYRTAGDDVDVCWRLQQAGRWITFAPGGFVWHHRRQTPRAYFRQQGNYGEAEALLRFQHPDRFNHRGEGKWNGVLYGPGFRALRIDRPIIYRGTFGTGLFQCIYQPHEAHWATLPSTLEWHFCVLLCSLAIPLWTGAAWMAGTMWFLSWFVAGLQSGRASIPSQYDGIVSRMVLMLLCYAQPLVRSWRRQKTRLFFTPRFLGGLPVPGQVPLPRIIWWSWEMAYWTETPLERVVLLDQVIRFLDEQRWSRNIDTGWKDWDLEMFCNQWTVVRIATAQEEHGQGKRLLRVRYRFRASPVMTAFGLLGCVIATVGFANASWPVVAAAGVILSAGLAAMVHGAVRARCSVALVDLIALRMGFQRTPVMLRKGNSILP